MTCAAPLRGRLGSPRQVKALWLCWLTLSSHVLGGPPVPSHLQQPEDSDSDDADAVDVGMFATPRRGAEVAAGTPLPDGLVGRSIEDGSVADESQALVHGGSERQLAQTYPFFATAPYVNVVVYDSHGPECDNNYESPPKYTINPADDTLDSYWRDGTDTLRKRNMACGIAPARFVFTTSDLVDYVDPSVLAKMQLRITCSSQKMNTCQRLYQASAATMLRTTASNHPADDAALRCAVITPHATRPPLES